MAATDTFGTDFSTFYKLQNSFLLSFFFRFICLLTKSKPNLPILAREKQNVFEPFGSTQLEVRVLLSAMDIAEIRYHIIATLAFFKGLIKILLTLDSRN